MALASQIAGEEYYRVAIGQGMYTSELPSNIPDGFSAVCYNMVATGDSLENRIGIKRSSVDWKVMQTAPNIAGTVTGDHLYFFSQINPWGNDSTQIAFGWGSAGLLVPSGASAGNNLNLVRASGAAGAGDGFMSVSLPAGQYCIGMCQYNGTVYISLYAQGVHKVTNVNWTADTLTYQQIVSSAGGTIYGLFTFKDRLWGWNGNNLYFTNLPTTGGQPEQWAFAANLVKVVGPGGAGRIEQVVPLGNRLAIFTTNGLYTLLVEGAPGSWILRVLDSKSISTASQSAFESKGIIYYVNTTGVWATNTLTVTKLSAVIDDQWFLAQGPRCHTICSYEDGMVVSISKNTTDPAYFDKSNCKAFYSKLDPIGWTEWNVNRNQLGTGNYNLAMMWSMTDKIPTYLNADPTVYVMGVYTDSTEAVKTYPVYQFLIMDGGNDQYVTRANTLETQPVGIYLKTKHFDGGNQYNIKHAKKGMIELFSSDTTHQINTSWDIDATTSVGTEVRTNGLNDFVVGVGSNMIQIPNDFHYRRASLNVRTSLQTDNSQIKIKDVAIAQDTGRAEFEAVR